MDALHGAHLSGNHDRQAPISRGPHFPAATELIQLGITGNAGHQEYQYNRLESSWLVTIAANLELSPVSEGAASKFNHE